MKIHEYQAKELFRKAGVPVLESHVAVRPKKPLRLSPNSADQSRSSRLRSMPVAAERGTIIGNPNQRGVAVGQVGEEAATVAKNLLGNRLVTIQTGPEGNQVNQVLVEQGCDIGRELYLGIVLDRGAAMPVLMVSSEGGVEIEKVAAEIRRKSSRAFPSPIGLGRLPGSQALQEAEYQRAGCTFGRHVHASSLQVLCDQRLLAGGD